MSVLCAEVWGKTDTGRGRGQHSEAGRTRTPRCRCVRVKGRKEARADNCLGGVKEGASEFI